MLTCGSNQEGPILSLSSKCGKWIPISFGWIVLVLVLDVSDHAMEAAGSTESEAVVGYKGSSLNVGRLELEPAASVVLSSSEGMDSSER